MTKTPRVLIVGGGLAGLALAVALRQRGLRPSLIERAHAWSDAGAGLYLVGNGTRALQALGLAADLERRSYSIRTQTFYNDTGARLAEIDVAKFWASCGPCVGIKRAALHQLLVERVGDLPARHGLTVAALEPRAEALTVRLSDGSVENYDFVVGADGVRSSVRRQLFGDAPLYACGQVSWRFVAPRPKSIHGWTVYLGHHRTFLLVPISDERVYCYADWTPSRPEDDPAGGHLERLRALFSAFANPVGTVLAELEPSVPIHYAPLEEVRPASWGRGRVILIGDAAHAMSPNMASGAALAVEDALVLARLLVEPGAGPRTPLAFARRRAPRVNWTRSQTHRRDRTRDLSPVLRDLAIRLFGHRTYRANYRPLLATLDEKPFKATQGG
jgi:2-polyprenyl-6-methoxyphenol hydroxylase-like FAD-dependent oxidoreductase